jgi:hypothetical protein
MKPKPEQPTPSTLVTNGVLSAAKDLGLTGATLAQITGLSTATVSRLNRGSWLLQENTKPYEISLVLIQIHHALKALMGDNLKRMKAWLHARNEELGQAPMALLGRLQGLFRVLSYLERLRPKNPTRA